MTKRSFYIEQTKIRRSLLTTWMGSKRQATSGRKRHSQMTSHHDPNMITIVSLQSKIVKAVWQLLQVTPKSVLQYFQIILIIIIVKMAKNTAIYDKMKHIYYYLLLILKSVTRTMSMLYDWIGCPVYRSSDICFQKEMSSVVEVSSDWHSISN